MSTMPSSLLNIPRHIPHITLTNFLWFLVALNIILFIYIQISNRRSRQKTSGSNIRLKLPTSEATKVSWATGVAVWIPFLPGRD
ncbi:hypothetical protein DFP73DRAFT_594590 [Morchella snyderi]|nr:hypothetical protein DFP73DRAFT_594590 [Morchella snyderi]